MRNAPFSSDDPAAGRSAPARTTTSKGPVPPLAALSDEGGGGAAARGAAPARLPVCPDCPATRSELLEELALLDVGCAFRCVALAPRQPLPPRWPGSYALALVRRGVVVRQRIDTGGRATAIDAIGSGAGFVLGEGDPDSVSAGYAASAALVCLCPLPTIEAGLQQDPEVARDLWRLAQRSLERVERLADARSRATAEARIGALLCALADTLFAKPRDVVPATLQQRDLAVLVAVRHESVCRVLRKFGERGLVRRDSEGIHLLDRSRLVALDG